ncbi:MAG: acyltransferase [Candidatus Electrothrix sp. ATG1]|nr:acyltransferase [Candidatus Electrothrix sp. ATG1]
MDLAREFHHIRESSFWRTLLWIIRTRKRWPSVLISPNVYCGIGPGAVVCGSGRLLLGTRHKLGRFMPSEIKLHAGSELCVKGFMSINTGCSISVNPGGTLLLGSGFINDGVTIDCTQRIQIGNDVAISKKVVIRDSDSHFIDDRVSADAPVVIGDRVWIGVNAIILKGVRIGNGSVVAAGAVVTKNMPASSLIAGVPASVIRENITWKL